MFPETLQTITDISGLLISFAGFLVVIFQLFRVDKSLQNSARGSIYDMASRIKAVFVEKPHLRPYFFDGEPINADHPHYQEAVSVADYYCLYLEQITTQQKNIDKKERESWLRYAHDTYHASPLLQAHLKGKTAWYSPQFWEVMAGKF